MEDRLHTTRPSPTRTLIAKTVFRNKLIGSASLANKAAGPPGRSAKVMNASDMILIEPATCIVPSMKRRKVTASTVLLI